MALILNIDTATETGSIALSSDESILSVMMNEDQKDHAAWIHNAIREMMQDAGSSLKELNAIAVTAGPGSYTGLRVGMATAKGLCYALNIPLVTENTLKVMARAATASKLAAEQARTPVEFVKDKAAVETVKDKNEVLFCPMIDARRMEVFTAVYDASLHEVMKPQPLILDAGSFAGLIDQHQILFFGSGSAKFKSLMPHPHASFNHIRHNAADLASLAQGSFMRGAFTDPAYAEPVYLKEFHTHTKK